MGRGRQRPDRQGGVPPAVAALGVVAKDTVCDFVFDDYDFDGGGEIEYKEYIRCSRPASERSAPAMDLFKKWDDDGSGGVDRKEFCRAIRSLGFDAPQEDLDALFDEMDGDTGLWTSRS